MTGSTEEFEFSVEQSNAAAGEPDAFFESPLANGGNIAADYSPISDGYLDARDNERRRLGRDLHDSTGQLLVSLSLSVAHLRRSHDAQETEHILGEIDGTVHQIDEEIRTFSFINYPAELGKNDLVVVLEMFARGFGKRTGLKVKFQSCCKQAQAHPAVAEAFLRIAQEALTNVHRHARAGSAHLSLAEHRQGVELTVNDDGCGISAAHVARIGEGVGLQGMRHRIERLGGTFCIRRMKQGTKLTASLPAARFYARGQLLGCAA